MRRAPLAALVLLLAASRVDAHPAPFSYLDLQLEESAVDGWLTLHVIDVAHELGIASPADLFDEGTAASVRDRVIALVAPRLSIRSGDAAVAIEWGRLEPARERDAVRLPFRAAAADGRLAIRALLFPYDPVHQTFLNIYEDGTLRHQAVFSASSAERIYYRDTTQGALAVVATFVPAGVHHILIGPDHILFLVGLLLLGGGAWTLVRIVTAFTVGHSVTLSLAALDLVTAPASVVEPAIALSIVFVGADNLLVGTSGRDVREWIALAFGLVHGFGFAGVLREFGLPPEALAWSLFSFNLGVEVGQLAIVLAVATALALLRARHQAAARRLAFAGSVVVMAAGAYWFVERVFFTGGTS